MRLKVRKVDEAEVVSRAIRRANETNKPVFELAHGGSVGNSYHWPAETEGCVALATPEGVVWCRTVRLPANKVTLGGVFAKATGVRGPFDARFSKRNQRLLLNEAKRKVLEKVCLG